MSDLAFPPTRFELDDDRLRARISIGAETIVADAATIERFIAHLGLLRSQMQPDVPLERPPEGQFLVIDGPGLAVHESHEGTHVGFVFRTPAYGWIGFNLPRAQAESMARTLVEAWDADVLRRASGNGRADA